MAPYLVVYVALLVVPLFFGWWLSFQEHRHARAGPASRRGLAQLRPTSSRTQIFRGAVWNTFRFVLMTVPAFVILGLGLALALNRPGKLGAGLRAIFFGSSVLSVTIVTLVWRLVLLPERGLLADLVRSSASPRARR